jgi:hypothetical protein
MSRYIPREWSADGEDKSSSSELSTGQKRIFQNLRKKQETTLWTTLTESDLDGVQKRVEPKTRRKTIQKTWEAPAYFRDLQGELRILGDGLTVEKVNASPATVFGHHLEEIILDAVALPDVTIEAISRAYGWSTDTIGRIRKGALIPPERYEDLISAIESASGRPVNAENKEAARAALIEALELPRTCLEKYKAEKERYAELTARVEAGTVRIGQLQDEISSIGQQLANLFASGAAAISELLRRLEQARAELRQALDRRDDDNEELRGCAERLIRIVDEVAQHFNSIL